MTAKRPDDEGQLESRTLCRACEGQDGLDDWDDERGMTRLEAMMFDNDRWR